MRCLLACCLLAAACGGNKNNLTSDGGSSGNCLGGQIQFMDVCLSFAPATAATRTPCGDITEFCDKTATQAPSLGCLTAAPKQHPATPSTVTLTGFVHPFSSGNSNSLVTIQIYKAADLAGGADIGKAQTVVPPITVTFDPGKATDPTQFRACDADPKVGCVATMPSACVAPTCNDGLSGRNDDKKYCRLMGGAPTCNQRLRWEERYSIDGVPTNTPLVIRTSGVDARSDQTWAVLVTWNVFFATDDKSCSGDGQAVDCLDTSVMSKPKYQYNVNVLSQSDYANIPAVAGLSSGISAGQGAVAGEIHDCDNIRLTNVQVGVAPGGDRFTYFNGNPYNTIPDAGRASIGTDRLGLYSALNVPPGKVVVEAAGLAGGKETLVGRYTAYVYPNAVSVVNLNGGKPQQ